MPGAGLGAALGLAGRRSFLVQHQVLSLGHSYRVMDPEKNPLFTVQGNASQNLKANLLGSLAGGSDSYFGRMEARSGEMSYALSNAQGQVLGTIRKQGGANRSTFTMADASGQPWVVVSLERGLMGGITATAVGGDGRPILQTSGSLLGHTFAIQDPQGGDQAKVHEAWVAVRDTYGIDIVGNIDPIYPLLFSIIIDFEKVK